MASLSKTQLSKAFNELGEIWKGKYKTHTVDKKHDTVCIEFVGSSNEFTVNMTVESLSNYGKDEPPGAKRVKAKS